MAKESKLPHPWLLREKISNTLLWQLQLEHRLQLQQSCCHWLCSRKRGCCAHKAVILLAHIKEMEAYGITFVEEKTILK